MKSVCLILTLSGYMVPIDKPFPSADSCERAGFSMTDGKTVKGYACLPRFMVDGLPTYDCGQYNPDMNLTPPPMTKCIFDVMKPDGTIFQISAACDIDMPNAVNIRPSERPPIPKYQNRME